jgi:hypothetical protein
MQGQQSRGKDVRATIHHQPGWRGIDGVRPPMSPRSPAYRAHRPVPTFRTFRGDLHHLADWGHADRITMYWIPVVEIDVCLLSSHRC